jgi:hypothetical protein
MAPGSPGSTIRILLTSKANLVLSATFLPDNTKFRQSYPPSRQEGVGGWAKKDEARFKEVLPLDEQGQTYCIVPANSWRIKACLLPWL